MPAASSGKPWQLRGIAVVAMFVFLNQVFGTGSISGLVDASWSQPLTWAGALLGLLVSVFLVETCRRADWKSPRWFIEVFGIIGAYVVFWDLWSNLLEPALDPIFEPVFDSLPVWGVAVVLVVCLAAGVLAIARTIKRDWGGEGTANER